MFGYPGRARVGDPVSSVKGAKHTLNGVCCNCTVHGWRLHCGCGLWSLVVEPITSCPQNIFPTPSDGISASTPSTTAVCPITYTASPVFFSSTPPNQPFPTVYPSVKMSVPAFSDIAKPANDVRDDPFFSAIFTPLRCGHGYVIASEL